MKPVESAATASLSTWVRHAQLLAALLASTVSTAHAHDTWFEVRATGSPPALWLGTGDRFPVQDSRVTFEQLKRHGCARHSDLASAGTSAARPLAPVSGPAGRIQQALALRLPSAATDPTAPLPHTCWATLVPFDIEIEPAKVEVYLKEIGAGPNLRAAWAAEQAAGRSWQERYVKHARVEVGAASPMPVGLQLEAVLLTPSRPKVGEPLRLQLLWGGKALADQPVEFVTDSSKLGIWRRTDEQGQVSLALPLAGRWLLRSTHLRAPTKPGERWQSDFVTLAWDVQPVR